MTTAERFLAKVEKTDACWLWTAALFPNGYGTFWDGTKHVRAHRYAYELLVGPIPEGLDLDHLCRVRHCVNPEHLEPVTRLENLLRAPRFAPGRTHCPNEHELTARNVRVERNGYRRCRTCDRLRTRARRAPRQLTEGMAS